MNLDAAWKELVPRLEADLSARHDPSSGITMDDEAWTLAEQLLRISGNFLRGRASFFTADDMNDIVQETILKLQSVRTMQRLRAAGSPLGYVTVMMRNALLDFARQRRREVALDHPLQENSAPQVSPETEIAEPHEIQRMKEGLRLLRPEDRYLLRLRFWKNMGIKEISQKLGISYSATAVRLFRILSRLREIMEA